MENNRNVSEEQLFQAEKMANACVEDAMSMISLFETYLKTVDVNKIESIFRLNHDDMSYVFGYFQGHDLVKEFQEYEMLCSAILYGKEELKLRKSFEIERLEISGVDLTYKLPVFLTFMKRIITSELERIRAITDKAQRSLRYEKEFKALMEDPEKMIDGKKILEAKNFIRTFKKEEFFSIVFNLLHKNRDMVEDLKLQLQDGTILSHEEQQEKKKQLYESKYQLSFDSDVTLEAIEEVISSFSMDLTYLRQHPEVFSSKRALFLSNIEFLKSKKISLKLLLDRDPDAFLCDHLKKYFHFIEMYNISIEELLFYQEKALTNLSYFGILDLMLENQCLDLNKLRDTNSVDLKKRMVLRLLNLPVTSALLKEQFPLSQEETEEFLKEKSTVLKDGLNDTTECELDDLFCEGNIYNFEGVIISRPKVLRNMDGQEVDLDTILCNGFYREDEIIKVKNCMNKEFYQKKRGVL